MKREEKERDEEKRAMRKNLWFNWYGLENQDR